MLAQLKVVETQEIRRYKLLFWTNDLNVHTKSLSPITAGTHLDPVPLKRRQRLEERQEPKAPEAL
jgi:hypothetical protein